MLRPGDAHRFGGTQFPTPLAQVRHGVQASAFIGSGKGLDESQLGILFPVPIRRQGDQQVEFGLARGGRLQRPVDRSAIGFGRPAGVLFGQHQRGSFPVPEETGSLQDALLPSGRGLCLSSASGRPTRTASMALGAPPSPTRRAICAASVSPPIAALCSNPHATPWRSAVPRFWLTFHLPTRAGEHDFDADDGTQHRCDVVVGRIAHRPGRGALRLMDVGEPLHQHMQPRRLIDRAQPTARLHRHVVPGRHDFAVLGLARVERRRHIRLRALEDHQRVEVKPGITPQRVGARDMAAQGSERGRLGVDQERQRVRPAGRRRSASPAAQAAARASACASPRRAFLRNGSAGTWRGLVVAGQASGVEDRLAAHLGLDRVGEETGGMRLMMEPLQFGIVRPPRRH